ncbi:MAG: universal stress protein [Nitrospinae bacterium]|nr:universal stress protein [Nitrospinota bacterium]
MYRNILVTLDNSRYSLWGLERALELATNFKATLVGNHVYASRLHEKRFVQMEPGLPAQYQEPAELQKQRDIHAELIERGLQVISDSYLDVFQSRCDSSGVACSRKMMEGKNYLELVRDIDQSSYDLVAIGARGLGEVEDAALGSVCERVTRRISIDALVMKNDKPLRGGHVVVGVDGSEQSFAAVASAIAMCKHMGCRMTLLAVFDPFFHYKAFDTIAEVLSEEAGKTFRFDEQEKLHKEIIDSGLEKIYRDHLDTAALMAKKEGIEAASELLAGKPYHAILQWIGDREVSLLALGKVGAHCVDEQDIGSNTEKLLRYAPCNVMLVSRKVKPDDDADMPLAELNWTDEAQEMLMRVPGFVRNMVRGHMEKNARNAGADTITGAMMREAREKMGM